MAILCLTSCTYNTKVNSAYQRTYDFTQVQGYSFYPRNSDFTDIQNLADTKRNSIEIAIEKTMDSKGFHYTEFHNADLIITYHIMTDKHTDYSRYNKAVLFCQACLKASTWHTIGKDFNLAVGDLIIDLVNRHKKRSVWRSALPLKISVKDNSQEAHEKISATVQKLLNQYPIKAFE